MSDRRCLELNYKLCGEVQIDERTKGTDDSCYGSTLLAQRDGACGSVSFGFNTDPEFSDNMGFYLSASYHHVENDKTGRAFHVNAMYSMTREDVRQLANFLLLITNTPKEWCEQIDAT